MWWFEPRADELATRRSLVSPVHVPVPDYEVALDARTSLSLRTFFVRQRRSSRERWFRRGPRRAVAFDYSRSVDAGGGPPTSRIHVPRGQKPDGHGRGHHLWTAVSDRPERTLFGGLPRGLGRSQEGLLLSQLAGSWGSELLPDDRAKTGPHDPASWRLLRGGRGDRWT